MHLRRFPRSFSRGDGRCFGGYYSESCSKSYFVPQIAGTATECDGPPMAYTPGAATGRSADVDMDPQQLFSCAETPNRAKLVIEFTASVPDDLECSIGVPGGSPVSLGHAWFTASSAASGVNILGRRNPLVARSSPKSQYTIQIGPCKSTDRSFERVYMEVQGTILHVAYPNIRLQPEGRTSSMTGQHIEVVLTQSSAEVDIAVDGVVVSGPPIFRTILANETDDTLSVVRLLDAESLSWERHLSAIEDATWDSQAALPSPTDSRRRISLENTGNETTNSSAKADVFEQLTAVEADVRILNPSTFQSERLLDLRTPPPYGVFPSRVLISKAVVPFNGSVIRLYREWVQPFNFSRMPVDVALRQPIVGFLTPRRASGTRGYASIVVQQQNDPYGAFVNVTKELYYTTKCLGAPNQYGEGLDCRPCPVGGVCPGSYRLWPAR